MKEKCQMTDEQKSEFAKAIAHYGNLQKLSAAIGFHMTSVKKWINGSRRANVEACMFIDKDTKGLIKRYKLRPDVDW